MNKQQTTNNKQQTTNNKQQVFGKLLGILAGKLGLYNILVYLGIEGFFYRIFNRERVKESINFFASNKEKVTQVITMLNDDESKSTYKKTVLYRQSRYVHNRPKKCKENEYFLTSLFTINDNEVFIDCGAYTGDTINNFIEITKNQFKKIVAFEPDAKNFQVLDSTHTSDSRIILYNAGVWSKDETVSFYGDAAGGSKIAGMENNAATDIQAKILSIQVKALDNVKECKDATFIKMDIEGAELNALEGAISLIIKNRPKLAICIYHSDDDMIRIPIYLYSKLKDYLFYVRHHSYSIGDTILYCIPK